MLREIITSEHLHTIINQFPMLSTVNLSLAKDVLDSYRFHGNVLEKDPVLWEVENLMELSYSVSPELYYSSYDPTMFMNEIKSNLVRNFIHDIDALYSKYILDNISHDHFQLTDYFNIIDLAHSMLLNFDPDFKGIPVQGPSNNELILYTHPANMAAIQDAYYISMYNLKVSRKVIVEPNNNLKIYQYIMPDDLNIWGRDLCVPINVSINLPENCLILANKFNMLFDMREAVIEEYIAPTSFRSNCFKFTANTNYGVADLNGIRIVKFNPN